MTIVVANAGDGLPVLASDMAQVFHNVNGSPNLVAYFSNNTWQVPNGCHKFRVTLYGGGGAVESDIPDEFGAYVRGEDGVRARTYFSGVDVGTTFNVVVGAGQVYTGGPGSGGVSSFGPNFSAPGGRSGITTYREAQSATFPSGLIQLYVNPEYVFPFADFYRAWGSGGYSGGDAPRSNGYQGLVIIEW